MGDLKENELVTNKNKCQFGRKFVKYLGHIISRKRVPSWLQTKMIKSVRMAYIKNSKGGSRALGFHNKLPNFI